MSDRDEWVKETQMFQRIAGIPETSKKDLGDDWDQMKLKDRSRMLRNIKDHRIIQDVAVEVGRKRSD